MSFRVAAGQKIAQSTDDLPGAQGLPTASSIASLAELIPLNDPRANRRLAAPKGFGDRRQWLVEFMGEGRSHLAGGAQA